MTVDWREVKGRYIKDPRLGHRLGRSYPGGEISDEYWNLRWLGTDQYGLIHNGDVCRDYHLADKRYKRVFLLGGSTVMGLGVQKNSETIASWLERELRTVDDSFRVANCGVGAYMSWHELLYLSMELIGYEPDVVILLDGHNDFVHSCWGNKGLGGEWIPNTHRSLDDIVAIVQRATGDVSSRRLLKELWRSTGLGRLYTRLREEFHSPATTKVKLRSSFGETDYATWSVKESSIEWYIRNIRSSLGVCAMNGTKVAHLFQPQLFHRHRTPTREEEDLLERLDSRMPRFRPLCREWCSRTSRAYSKLVEEFSASKGIIVEDAGDWLSEVESTVYHDFCHYNVVGQRIIAKRLTDVVGRLLSLPLAHRAEAPPHPQVH